MHRVSLAALHDIFTGHADLEIEHIPGVVNVSDIFTKALPGPRHTLLRGWLGVLPEGSWTLPYEHPARAGAPAAL